MSTPPVATRWFSLRRRLLLWLLGGVTFGWLGAVGFAYVDARHEVFELLQRDQRLAHGKLEKHLQHELAEALLEALLTPLLFGLPLLGGGIWFATRRGLAPLDEIAALVAARAPHSLDPLAPVAAPTEIRPLVDALDGLFARVGRSLDEERRFTADAAHELRTPLAALVVQAQVAMRAQNAVERDHALAQIAAGSRRAARLVDQLLTLARLDPAAVPARQSVRLDQLAAEVCANHGAQALEQDIALELDAPQPLTLDGNPDLLRVLLRNLLDNALRYTPAGGKVGVGVTAQAGKIALTVWDTGPGVPAVERDKILQRFHRLAGQDVEGSGLGLSIVARIAELHDARLQLDDHAPGLRVALHFPYKP